MIRKVLVVVKAEPVKSMKYGACVCTAGITDHGDFIRLYPVPYWVFSDPTKRFRKYDWIEVDCNPSDEDDRPESNKIDPDSIKIVGHIDTDDFWAERNRIVLPKCSKNIKDIKQSGASIGLIKPSELLDFKFKYLSKDDEPIKKEYGKSFQMIFDLESGGTKILPDIKKMDRHYTYSFKCDEEETQHNIMCEDWELYQSSREWLKTYGTEEKVWEKIYQKYFDDFSKKNDLYFFMGTHNVFKTWMIIGVYYPLKPKIPKNQTKLFCRSSR